MPEVILVAFSAVMEVPIPNKLVAAVNVSCLALKSILTALLASILKGLVKVNLLLKLL